MDFARFSNTVNRAASEGDVATLSSLLAETCHLLADPAFRKSGNDALCNASWYARAGAVGVLLAAGFDPRWHDDYGRTAELFGHWASKRARKARGAAVRALLEACLGEFSPPGEYTVKIVGGRMSASDVRAAQDRLEAEMAAEADLRPRRVAWQDVGKPRGRVWLHSAEAVTMRLVMSRAARLSSYELVGPKAEEAGA